MDVARRGLNLPMAKQFADHRQALAERQGARVKGVPQIVSAQVIQFRAGAEEQQAL